MATSYNHAAMMNGEPVNTVSASLCDVTMTWKLFIGKGLSRRESRLQSVDFKKISFDSSDHFLVGL